MGRMYFPGEKAKEYLPPRESEGDFVARFGAWLTEDGAACIAYIACAIPAVMGGCKAIEMDVWNVSGEFLLWHFFNNRSGMDGWIVYDSIVHSVFPYLCGCMATRLVVLQ